MLSQGSKNILKIIIFNHIKNGASLSNFWNSYRDSCQTKKVESWKFNRPEL
jgi:hypothetical protein